MVFQLIFLLNWNLCATNPVSWQMNLWWPVSVRLASVAQSLMPSSVNPRKNSAKHWTQTKKRKRKRLLSYSQDKDHNTQGWEFSCTIPIQFSDHAWTNAKKNS